MSAIDEKLRGHRVTVDGRLVPLESSSTRHRRRRIVHRALATADAAGLTIAFAVSFALYATSASGAVRPELEIALFAISIPLWIAAFMIKGLYDKQEDIGYSMVDDAAGVFVVMSVGVWLLYLIDSVTGLNALGVSHLSVFWLVAFVAIPVCRGVARRWARSNAAYLQNVIIVGTGPVGRLFARRILAHPEYGLNLVGFVDVDPAPGLTHVGSVPVLGTNAELGELVDELAVDRVVVSFTSDSPEATMALIRSIRDQSVEIDIVPRLFEIIGSSSTMQMIGGAPLVALPHLRLSRSSRLLKRALDLALAVPALVLLAPLLVGVAIAIKLDSRGPVLFRQVRRGEDESTFTILKFRSMAEDAEENKEAVAHLNLHGADDPRMFKVAGDPRMTRVGAFLRRWSIDEVPQLFNVIKGDMSLVGPRPLILAEDQHVIDWARKRLSIKPGITGLWQVLGRSDIPFDEMTKLDYLYLTNWSLRQDVRLILMTIPALFRSRAAY